MQQTCRTFHISPFTFHLSIGDPQTGKPETRRPLLRPSTAVLGALFLGLPNCALALSLDSYGRQASERLDSATFRPSTLHSWSSLSPSQPSATLSPCRLGMGRDCKSLRSPRCCICRVAACLFVVDRCGRPRMFPCLLCDAECDGIVGWDGVWQVQ
jgi:hypothetical protein